jgi:hypothetical protein
MPVSLARRICGVSALLIVARLTVRSTYAQNWEADADNGFDTVQFYLPGDGAPVFRVRTFAVDHDIHVHQLGSMGSDAPPTLLAHLERIFGDVTASVHSVALPHRSTQDLVDAGLTTGHLEWAPQDAFAFWNPDGATYRTQSRPADDAPPQADRPRST